MLRINVSENLIKLSTDFKKAFLSLIHKVLHIYFRKIRKFMDVPQFL